MFKAPALIHANCLFADCDNAHNPETGTVLVSLACGACSVLYSPTGDVGLGRSPRPTPSCHCEQKKRHAHGRESQNHAIEAGGAMACGMTFKLRA